MNQITEARKGNITPEMIVAAKDEGFAPELIAEKVANGTVTLVKNVLSKRNVLAVGEGLKTKINANIGTSKDHTDIDYELKKVKVLEDAGADALMDLSTGGDVDGIRKKIIANTKLPIGTVPIYQAALEAVEAGRKISSLTADDLFDVMIKQAKDGVDFMTLHCGITQETVKRLDNSNRIMGVVSRGGAFLVNWIKLNGKENPFYEYFDRVVEIAKEYDITLSLGDGMRPGCLVDATDRVQIQELVLLGELTKQAVAEDVQVMIEGPGHVPVNDVAENIKLQKRLCNNAPFYVLGPLVTDIAPGYDHITSAVGGTIAAANGADFLCYVTPAEHLRLPSLDDVKEGVMACRIAAHAGDIAKGVKGAIEKDIAISECRRKRDWEGQMELCIDPVKARAYKGDKPMKNDDCTMCSELCSLKVLEECNI